MLHLTDQAISQFVGQHYLLIGFVLWMISNIISTMPSPDDKSSTVYRWLFNLLHTAMGNAGRIAGARGVIGALTGIVSGKSNGGGEDGTPQVPKS